MKLGLFFISCAATSSTIDCCDKISISGLENSAYNGIYSSTGLYNNRDYYVKENGYGYMYFQSTTNKDGICMGFSLYSTTV